jgi:class 3 adenylate cyclase
MDVTDWLRGLGLERYAAAFRENEVGADLLPSLTTQDLRDLGVTSVGHRRRLLGAIAALAGDHPPQPTSEAAADDRASAERRQLTVLFCDLVGSTPLSIRLDPEDLREVLHTYRASVVAAVAGQHGYVAKYLGDGVLAYFGWPNPDEVHAASAVRAALAILEAVRSHALRGRVGIATGLVIVGDLIGAGAAREHPAIGETPNLAARLQALAEPDTIVVSEATRAQLGRMFELEELGALTLKGFDKPVLAWRVRRETGIASRSELLYSSAVPPLIGRDEELDLLLRRWRQAKEGEGRVVLLSGEAGIGKSRLLAALEERLAGEPHVGLRYFCSAHHQDSALNPIIARLEQEAGFDRGDTAEDRLAKLEAVLASTDPAPDDAALLASLLSIPAEAGYPALEFSPQRRKERTFAALTRRLASFACRGPVLVLFEDAHWSDPTSLELLDAVIEQAPDLRMLLVIAFRPDFSPPWFGRPGVSQIILGRLDPPEATALAEQIATDRALAPALLDRIVAQADGVPLFIEELTKAVQETGFDPAGTLAVQASLMARLDRLPVAKQVAQMGAVIGREFSHSLLEAVAQMPEPQLARGIEELVGSGLAFRRGTPQGAAYAFKHALVQDVAYESLLRSRRAEVHAKIATMLEREGDNAGPKLALIGHHCANAGLMAKAATYYRLAGERSGERAAFSETMALLDRGLALAEGLPESSDRANLQAELLVARGRALQMTKGLMDPEAARVSEQAIVLARAFDHTEPLTRALMVRYYSHIIRCDLAGAWRYASELLDVSMRKGDAAAGVLAHICRGYVDFHRGRFSSTYASVEAGRTLHSSSPEVRFSVPLELAAVQSAAVFTAFSLACLGYLDQAATQISQHYDGSQEMAPLAKAFGLSHVCRYDLVVRRDIAAFRSHNDLLVSIADHQESRQFALMGRYNQGWLEARSGQAHAGMAILQAARDEMDTLEYRLFGTYYQYLLADALRREGRSSATISALTEGLSTAARRGDHWVDAELRRFHGELLLQGNKPDPVQAERELRTAIDVAREQSAKLFELRAATSLARLWSGQGRRAEARDLLAPVHDWFTEGFGSVDLQESRAVLAELGEPPPSHRRGVIV